MGYNDNPPYFLTAYDIAVRWGFKGTEEDWLNSLTAFAMAQEAGYAGTVEDWLADLIDPVPNLQIGEVTTLDGGSKATATITGSKRNPMLNLGIPRGVGMTDALPLVGGTMKGGINMGANQIVGLPEPVQETGAVPKSYSDRNLPLNGSRAMQGELNMDDHEIKGLPTPTSKDSAVPKEYVDKKLKEYADQMLPKTGGTMSGNIMMGNSKIKNLGTPTENDDAANMGFVNQQVRKAAPRNLSDNSDFSQFVAQAGIGQKHEPNGPTYADDRWILESGTVTGEKRDDGNGYTNITLNGTIRQKVANAPDVGTAAIEMVSGMADISYENGEITITSNGGTIKNVRLFKGAYSNDSCPAHQPKGYGAELAECQRYYLWIVEGTSNLYLLMAIGGSVLYGILNTPVTMRINPTPVFTGLYARKTSNVTSIADIDRCAARNEGLLVSMTTDGGALEAGTVYQIRCENGLLAFAADL